MSWSRQSNSLPMILGSLLDQQDLEKTGKIGLFLLLQGAWEGVGGGGKWNPGWNLETRLENPSCSSSLSLTIPNIMTKGNLGSHGFISPYPSCNSPSSGGRHSRQELKPVPWPLTDLHIITCSACFLHNPRSSCPGVAPATVDWTFPH